MEYNEILNKLGPCGLSCEKCFAFSNGKIQKHSVELKKNLGNFDVYAKRFIDLLDEPVFKKYPDFKVMLNHFSNVECKGCRKDECKLFMDCKVKQCSKGHSVDFCFQCAEFPCKKHGFDEHLEKRWIMIQNEMNDTCVEDYYNKTKDTPRY